MWNNAKLHYFVGTDLNYTICLAKSIHYVIKLWLSLITSIESTNTKRARLVSNNKFSYWLAWILNSELSADMTTANANILVHNGTD